jgi:uncharacterized protein (TIGR02646 family)
MKAIIKQSEPKSLIKHRASQFASYNNLDNTDVRKSLITEQGHICCYCMKRIPEKNVTHGSKIEHFHCQENFPKKELDYSNMLLACSGNEGSPYRLQTCDTRKGKHALSYNPSNKNRNIETLIKYKSNGEIYSTDETFNNELETVLNLNVRSLKENRRIIYEEIQNRIKLEGKRLGDKTLKRRFLEDEKAKLLNKVNGKFQEYCMVGVYVIDKKLGKLA